MAHKNVDYKPEDIQFPNQKIVQSELVHEMQSSYIEYAMSVIVGRALPDVRDGLKPVHRRILYAMYEDGLTSDKAFKKSATCVGDVLGRYHPHGDASVYDALVRLAQDFSMRYMLVDGHGNFGSIDGDPPAAYRYTEARMSKIANEMLRDIDKETVDWDPNFDESRKEPRVLPARFPNLLVNGSSGIAVGMATNIPPHNLGETIDATCMMLDNPDVTTEELMTVLPGPDFPTGAIIMGREGIKEAYETGRGSLTIRSKCRIEEGKNGKSSIVISEIPYQVNRTNLLKKIADLVRDKKLPEVSAVHDAADRSGIDIIIDLKQNAIPQVVLNKLYKHTQLQVGFGCNMLALVNGVPRTLSLKEMLHYYILHQEEVIERRTRYDLAKAEARAHILEGLLIALDNIDEIVRMGTGAVEIKSGYGLTTADELKMLRVIRRIRESVPLEVRATFLGAHAVPRAYVGRQEEYVDLVCNEMLPAVAAEGLADFVDVFCDEGFFTVEQTARIMKAGRKLGMQPKIHANELAVSGGVQVGVAHGALSVDHLERMGAEEIAVLKASRTMPTMLPGAAFFLGMPYPPAREMIRAGLGVALASDYNPGSSPSGNMKTVVSLACIKMKMTPAEALNAATLNGAAAMDLSRDHGSVSVGKRADFFLTRPIPSVEFVPYAYSTPLIRRVFLGGREVWAECGR